MPAGCLRGGLSGLAGEERGRPLPAREARGSAGSRRAAGEAVCRGMNWALVSRLTPGGSAGRAWRWSDGIRGQWQVLRGQAGGTTRGRAGEWSGRVRAVRVWGGGCVRAGMLVVSFAAAGDARIGGGSRGRGARLSPAGRQANRCERAAAADHLQPAACTRGRPAGPVKRCAAGHHTISAPDHQQSARVAQARRRLSLQPAHQPHQPHQPAFTGPWPTRPSQPVCSLAGAHTYTPAPT
jgi:hypothetical protein